MTDKLQKNRLVLWKEKQLENKYSISGLLLRSVATKICHCICVSLIMRRHLTMEQIGFPVHIIQLVANLYKEQQSVVRTTNGDTEWFKIERGVRQGCVISPGLYNIYAEHIMRCVLEEHHDGMTIGGRRETNLRFADYTTLLWTSKEELLAPLKKVKEAGKSQTYCLTHKRQRSWCKIKAERRKRTLF